MRIFCEVSGMEISAKKHALYHNSTNEGLLSSIQTIMPYQLATIDSGFKYLGFFLKPNGYQLEDWKWLLRKINQNISLWCYNWLYLGGRMILVKSVLENILVFWLAISKIPNSILNNMRQKMFIFIWTGKRNKEGIHLASWIALTKPKF